METFKTKIGCDSSEKEYSFECYDNTESIEIGDYFLFFFARIADVGQCQSEHEKSEINQNSRVRDGKTIDLVTGFWRNCYKIKTTNFKLNDA